MQAQTKAGARFEKQLCAPMLEKKTLLAQHQTATVLLPVAQL